VARPCPVCISYDRPAIDESIFRGRALADISRETGIRYQSLQRHRNNGHLSTDIAKKVARAQSLDMSSIMNHVVNLRDKTDTVIDSEDTPVQYKAQYIRASNESDKILFDVAFKAKQIQIEQEKLDLANKATKISALARAADYIRLFHPDEVDSFTLYMEGHS
jgi:hypothetical protein